MFKYNTILSEMSCLTHYSLSQLLRRAEEPMNV